MFTIERQLASGRPDAPGAVTGPVAGSKAPPSDDLTAVLEALKRIEKRLDQSADAVPAPQPTPMAFEGFAERVIEAERLKGDLRELTDAIEHTKTQIAALRPAGSADRIERAAIELDAVVLDTENATNRILAATEAIEELGNRLAAQSNDAAMSGIADELAERVVEIFEACNFQDITGQRITKVVDTMKFIDERVHRMIQIWGEEMLTTHAEPADGEASTADGDTLHGPALPEQRISQDEIDALFD
jgi:chemotaxis protein CheZ